MMKKTLTIVITLLAAITAMAQAPAFPGAEGHGRFVTGGREGNVIHVTNLNDSGEGSFRQAVNGSSKKIVVFDVGGVIPLKSDVVIGANTTIEGQTAPFPGITLRYYTVRPGANNIIRFIRIRRGQERDVNDGADAIWQRNVTGLIIDHCSFSWSIDEVASFYDNNNFTMQWCTIAESLNNAGHSKEAHGYGGIWGGKLASFHHNLIAHVNNRSPRFNGARYNWTGYTSNKLYSQYQWANAVQAENVDFRNCVVYNCGNGCYGGPGGGQINMVNNYFKTGPAATTNLITTVSVGSSGNASGYPTYWTMTSRYYIKGNQVNANTNYDWNGVTYDNGVYTINGERYSPDPNHYYGSGVEYKKNSSGTDCVRIKLDNPTATGSVTTHNASAAFDKVLDYAGASYNRDNVDERYMQETRNGTATYTGSITKKKGRIDVVSDVNGYTEANFGTGSRATGWDSDNDGMPDIWETANGLNPNNAADAKTYSLDPKGYYTNVEVYCNALVEKLMKEENEGADSSVEEYYPTVAHVDGVPYYGEDEGETPVSETATIAASTHTSDASEAEWGFQGGYIVSNNNQKAFTTGNEDGIKYSANVKYTIQLPDDIAITAVTFTGYDNYSEADSYLAELNGTSYGQDTYVFPKKNSSGAYTMTSHTINLDKPAKGTITFTPAGKQVVWVITLSIQQETPSYTEAEYTISEDTYLTSNNTTEWVFNDGVTVTNTNSKAYSVGKNKGIKYSKGQQYTIHLPEDFTATSVIVAGYGNEDNADAYLAELNKTTYNANDYVYQRRSNSYAMTSYEVDLNPAAKGTITITPNGAQAVWIITIKGYTGTIDDEPDWKPGDVNDDGDVNIADVMLTVSYVIGNITDGINKVNADVNQDNSIGISDVMTIVSFVIGTNSPSNTAQ